LLEDAPRTQRGAAFFCAPSTFDRRAVARAVEELMPRRTDISTILIVGAGPIIIGQACEFD
jgi:hypothetical protein